MSIEFFNFNLKIIFKANFCGDVFQGGISLFPTSSRSYTWQHSPIASNFKMADIVSRSQNSSEI